MRIGEGRSLASPLPTPSPPLPASSSTGPAAARSATPSPFARVLETLGREVDRGEALVGRISAAPGAGRELGHLELLSLQASVYRYSEAVDLSAKLVDRAASGVKTVIQGQ